ncbi:MAG TPA: DUF5672 family protein [Isosphaeraceae bacterium]|nr:DUF5672 family protein [Isosphaeraceae bacterium]
MSAPSVAITIPVYKPTMTDLEEMSLERCVEVLGRFPIVFFGPESLDYELYLGLVAQSTVVRFPDRYFRSLETYSELLLSAAFYKAFSIFEFMLIYQLDAFVFRDDLEYWCSRDFDYVGAPWWDEKMGWTGVGNGGFCLRKPARCLAVLTSRHKEDPEAFWAHVRRFNRNPVIQAMQYPRKIARELGVAGTVDQFLARFIRRGCAEDHFWGYAAVRYWPEFRLASVEDALRFSVEGGLQQAAARYKEWPPFGCHRDRYVRMVRRFLESAEPPAALEEALVWNLAELAGMKRTVGCVSLAENANNNAHNGEATTDRPAN